MKVDEAYRTAITTLMTELEAYDAQRPAGHVYEFHTHSKRVAKSMKSLALQMGYEAEMADALYWATLPHDIGKTALPLDIWDIEGKPSEDIKQQRRTHTWRGVQIILDAFGEDKANSDPFLRLMVDIMLNHHEACDGSGFMGKSAKDLSQEVRMACICDAFDGYSVFRPHFGDRDITPPAVIKRMRIEKDGQFDNTILNQFEKVVCHDC